MPVSSSIAYEASRVIKTGPGKLFSLDGYNSKGSAQFIQLHDAASLPADYSAAGVAEAFTFAFTGLTGADLVGKYFLFADRKGTVALCWDYQVGDEEFLTDMSAIAGRILRVKVNLADLAAVVGRKTCSRIDADSEFSCTLATATITVTNSYVGARTNASAGTSGVTPTTTVAGVDKIGIPIFTMTVATVANFEKSWPNGLPFSNGLVVCNSSTGPTKTIGSADCFFTAVTD